CRSPKVKRRLRFRGNGGMNDTGDLPPRGSRFLRKSRGNSPPSGRFLTFRSRRGSVEDMRIVITELNWPIGIETLSSRGWDVLYDPALWNDRERLRTELKSADAVIIRNQT